MRPEVAATIARVVTKIIRRSPRVAGILVGLAALGATGLLVAGCGDDGASLPEGVVARVGDTSVTQARLDKTIAQSRAQAKEQGQTLPASGEDGFDQVQQQALQQLIQQEVISSEARKCGTPCAVEKKDITAELGRIREANFNGSQKDFDAFLKRSAISKTDAQEIVRYQLQTQKLLAHVTRGVRFTAADARAYYDANTAQFTTPAGRQARHILVETKAEADAIRARLTLDNFAAEAKANSIDEGSAQQGGDLGLLQKGRFIPEFEKVAFALANGEISQPVKTQYGWHIITVALTPKKTTSFAEARAGIISSQLNQKRQEEWTAWGQKTLDEAESRTVYASDSLKPSTDAAAPAATTTTP